MEPFSFGKYKGISLAKIPINYLVWLGGEECNVAQGEKDKALAEIERRKEAQVNEYEEMEFNQDMSYSQTPTSTVKAEMPTSPGGVRKEHPKLESRFLLEFVSKVLGLSERGVRERMVRRNLAFTKDGYAKLLAEHIRTKKK